MPPWWNWRLSGSGRNVGQVYRFRVRAIYRRFTGPAASLTHAFTGPAVQARTPA